MTDEGESPVSLYFTNEKEGGIHLRIFITGPDGQLKAEAAGTERAVLVYDGLYKEVLG